MNELAIIGTVIVWVKYIFPVIKILMPITRRLKKPFNCAPCLAMWSTFFYELNVNGNILISFFTFVLTAILIREYDRATV